MPHQKENDDMDQNAGNSFGTVTIVVVLVCLFLFAGVYWESDII